MPARDRAWLISSRLVVMGFPSAVSARTQILSMDIVCSFSYSVLQDLQLLEELDDAFVGIALVDDDLADRTGFGVGHRGDLLA